MTNPKHRAWRRKASRLASFALTSLTACLVGGFALAGQDQASDNSHGWTKNPYSPAYDHPYRHGVMPTRETYEKMKAWENSHAAAFAAPTASTGQLSFGGGVNGVGVLSGQSKVYLIFYGTQ